MYVHVKDRLMTGRPVILAGSWSVELAAQGMAPSGQLWTSPANLEAPDAVRAAGEAFIRAGAHAVLANTFSTGPLLMHALGRLDDMERLDARAIGLLREAVDATGAEIALGASFSVYGAIPDDERLGEDLSAAELERLFARKAAIFRDHGVDFIYMERVRGIRRGVIATEAAVATGLPVWVELAVQRGPDGGICSTGPCHWQLQDMVSGLMSTGAAACVVSSADPLVIADALQVLRMAWAGYQGVSLVNGRACVPAADAAGKSDGSDAGAGTTGWQTGDVTPEDYVIEADRWRRQKAQIFALTAGLGAAHVAALAKAFGPA